MRLQFRCLLWVKSGFWRSVSVRSALAWARAPRTRSHRQPRETEGTSPLLTSVLNPHSPDLWRIVGWIENTTRLRGRLRCADNRRNGAAPRTFEPLSGQGRILRCDELAEGEKLKSNILSQKFDRLRSASRSLAGRLKSSVAYRTPRFGNAPVKERGLNSAGGHVARIGEPHGQETHPRNRDRPRSGSRRIRRDHQLGICRAFRVLLWRSGTISLLSATAAASVLLAVEPLLPNLGLGVPGLASPPRPRRLPPLPSRLLSSLSPGCRAGAFIFGMRPRRRLIKATNRPERG